MLLPKHKPADVGRTIAKALPFATSAAASLLLSVLSSPATATDNGQWNDASPTDREWFRGVRSPHGVPCCDMADGHRTTFEWRQDDAGGHFWVPIEGAMTMVPTEAIVWNAGNPFDTSIIWYVRQGAKTYYIRCFVPIGGV